ncbi:hexokinase-1-like isoform X1 [Vespa mandarinia]|uniref:hexokinase-1-like isoform X1 n=2 Tax=Vespa mandarinia TaxID=7446 RepID=UPI0016225DAD|nr:hexokinase-1-like isoform X1 [Vespa mandarinia]XP_035734414.1 hexokinase-1-like isoform X1 [Vespa mandarinia]XP_035734424.1 hexokinase-1-like isoform X1 [Vespa mandarinia]XP_035734434.1 hexokinase-1-like isoform X1 [Vespa mandarinia]XP_035734443.1 hexokinase-1-like isoform X1 [Vespa mandarinia]XP_035734453.1 hexokinase-1-like isoform X1 [Vespa mandarinia]XP_035734464.1 hexokinase-1-like isoform X1 [Vespa mandarinia]
MVVPAEHALHEAIQVSPLELSNDVRRQKIENRLARMRLSATTVRKIQDVFVSEMNKGIHQEPSSLQMENTYVPELVDGTEEGRFLALDLGGTNFRILLLELKNGRIVREDVKNYHIGSELRIGTGFPLFDYLAECVSDFVINQSLQDVEIPLGFTFSFPMVQHSLDVGILVTWTKSFNCPDVVNKDAVQLLRDALARRGDTKVKVIAVLNDTTGTLIQGATLDPDTAIGLILGTGSNACYLERADRVEHWEPERHGEREVVIDIEWGAFGDNGVLDFIKTEFDRENDANSLLVNSFTFEKYISGKYLGEIVRLVLVKLTKEGLLFLDKDPGHSFFIPGTVTSDLVSFIEQDTVDGSTHNTKEVLAKYDIVPTDDDINIVQYVCEVVSNRAALLVSICLAALLERIDKKNVTIAVDGSLYKHHPRFETWMKQYITLLAPGRKFKLIHVEDGSGKGAALIAAIAQRIQKRLT